MQPFTIVTGNQHKLAELRRLLPADLAFDHQALDLEEIQSFDTTEIVLHKVKQAYALVDSPVVVEDVSAGLTALNGLPGPFVKFFVEQLGRDALYTLSKDDKRATVTCTIGYYDGVQLFTVSADCAGTIVSMKSDAGFGIDGTFIPDGQTKTFAEMTAAEKDRISHRGKAVRLFLEQLHTK